MNPDLLNWLDNNKMCFNIIDEDVIEITGFGKMYYEDTSMIKSIFRTDADNNIKFNTMENIQTLQEEGINYIIRKSKFPQNPKRSVRFSGKRTKRSVQKRKARNTQKAETKVL